MTVPTLRRHRRRIALGVAGTALLVLTAAAIMDP
jgi:hypothetical protein